MYFLMLSILVSRRQPDLTYASSIEHVQLLFFTANEGQDIKHKFLAQTAKNCNVPRTRIYRNGFLDLVQLCLSRSRLRLFLSTR
jgi:hypothetical protein